MIKTSQRGIDLIKSLEGFVPAAYKDLGGVWTIGYGFTKAVAEGQFMTREDAEIRLRQELFGYELVVKNACTVLPTQNEFDAMVCLAWNIGTEGFTRSSVLAAHNRGDKEAAARAFALWNKVHGKVVKGLVRRRAMEAALYLEADAEPMPQAVDKEKPLSKSKITWGSAVAVVTSSIAGVKQAMDAAASVKDGVGQLGTWAIPVLCVIAAAAAAYALYQRWQQRQDGVA